MHEWLSAVVLLGHLATVKFGAPAPQWWKWPAAPLFSAAGAVCLAEGSQEQEGTRWGWGVLLCALLSAQAVQCTHALKLGQSLIRLIAIIIVSSAVVAVAIGVPRANLPRGGVGLVSVAAAVLPLLAWHGRRAYTAAAFDTSGGSRQTSYVGNMYIVDRILADLDYNAARDVV